MRDEEGKGEAKEVREGEDGRKRRTATPVLAYTDTIETAVLRYNQKHA